MNFFLILIYPFSSYGQNPKDFVRKQGNKLVVGQENQQILLHGIDMGNLRYLDEDSILIFDNYSLEHFQTVADMNMNVIRFYMDYRIFEDDTLPYVYKQEGWEWLDINIQNANEAGLYLLISISNPQGGWPNSETDGLWSNPENQNRLKELWKAIADRYSNEPIIAGFDLLNEPTSSESIDQYINLAQELIDVIRTVDQNHLIVVESFYGVWGNWGVDYQNPDNAWFLVNDDNLMYDFHFYHPHDFTHWFLFGGITNYPDSTVVYLPSDAEQADFYCNTPVVFPGNSDWSYYEGELCQATDSTLIAGMPLFFSAYNEGVVYFDDFVIKEYSESGEYIRNVIDMNIVSDSGWGSWNLDTVGILGLSNQVGYTDSISLMIENTTGWGAGWTGWDFMFPVISNNYYSISGWMKGVDVGNDASCRMKISYIRSPSGTQAMTRNKAYLEFKLLLWSQFCFENNLPINVGEFGVDPDLFNGHGGQTWILDMLDLMCYYGINHQYFIWEVMWTNQEIIDLFANYEDFIRLVHRLFIKPYGYYRKLFEIGLEKLQKGQTIFMDQN